MEKLIRSILRTRCVPLNQCSMRTTFLLSVRDIGIATDLTKSNESTNRDYVRPIISPPSALTAIDPAWTALCHADPFQGNDPPIALQQQAALVPQTTKSTPGPSSVPASPESTPSAPATNTNSQRPADPALVPTSTATSSPDRTDVPPADASPSQVSSSMPIKVDPGTPSNTNHPGNIGSSGSTVGGSKLGVSNSVNNPSISSFQRVSTVIDPGLQSVPSQTTNINVLMKPPTNMLGSTQTIPLATSGSSVTIVSGTISNLQGIYLASTFNPVTLPSTTVTPSSGSSGALIIAGQTVVQGGSGIPVAGETLLLAAGGSSLVIASGTC